MTWEQTLAEYGVSQLDDRVRSVLLKRGVSEDQIASYQVGHLHGELPDDVSPDFRKWAHGKIDDVILLPLTNALGEVRGFQLRALGQAKFRYHDYLPDKREACLFGLGQAVEAMWETKSVFLVEGAFDLFPVQRAFPPVVATLTARTGPSLGRLLHRLVDRVWVGYDMDEPGRHGCSKFLADYGRDFEVYIVSWPKLDKVKDPGDLWEQWGDSRLIPFVQDLTKLKPEGELYNG